MPNPNTQKLLNALDNPKTLANIRYGVGLFLFGLTLGLLAARLPWWALGTSLAALWLLWRARVRKEPRRKLAEMFPETPPEM